MFDSVLSEAYHGQHGLWSTTRDRGRGVYLQQQRALAREFLASEDGHIIKDWGGRLPITLIYPNSYSVGMSSLAIHGLYRWLNDRSDIVCERAFAWLGRRQREAPVITLESQRPIQETTVFAFSVSFEMDYLHVIDILRRSGVPLHSEERGEADPLIILGGPAVSANPQPMAAVADAILIGEIEPVIDPLVVALQSAWTASRGEILAALSRVPGVYVPFLWDGESVERQWLADLASFPLGSAIVAPRAAFGDMHLIEIARGCRRACLAGYWYLPPRIQELNAILAEAQRGLAAGRKIGLVASAVSDFPDIEELVSCLREMGARISVSSLRVKPLSPVLLDALMESGAQSITLAPEAGSERLRQAIHKGVSRDDILAAAEMVQGRFQTLKLYFMIGLPNEEPKDIEAILSLSREVKEIFGRQVIINVTPFVPKAHTPYEREAMAEEAILAGRLERIREGSEELDVQVRAESIEAARLQGVLSRGDRALGELLLRLERPSHSRLAKLIERDGGGIEHHLREREPDEALPWDFLAPNLGRRSRQCR